MHPFFLVFTAVLAAAWVSFAPLEAAAAEGVCQPIAYEEASYTVCTIDLRRHRLRLYWQGADGKAYGSFERLIGGTREGRRIVFAMNAGMYHQDLSPVGLYIEDGRELKKINTANGPGNFHLKPNGVFYLTGDRAGVLETERYLKRQPKAEFATQSGPMLVIDGKIHPRFSTDGTSLKVRNGVGIRNAQTVVFAISEGPVSFGAFARLFRDRLSCNNALFLDGTISSLYAPALNRSDGIFPLGPIVGATER
ncbi:phosphodiester glycosidase family protein [Microvirga sp. G4-2]|uniref:phosphodiester glycosidase family protein n=1 Tax=Microvirga sp. G4-2 TaxID=3434467 RepID=UPI0040444242